jgi:hypothetical protein
MDLINTRTGFGALLRASYRSNDGNVQKGADKDDEHPQTKRRKSATNTIAKNIQKQKNENQT